MSRAGGPPYWLIREPGRQHGVGTIDLDQAITSERAIELFVEEFRQSFGMHPGELEAELVALRYDEAGNPVVTHVA